MLTSVSSRFSLLTPGLLYHLSNLDPSAEFEKLFICFFPVEISLPFINIALKACTSGKDGPFV